MQVSRRLKEEYAARRARAFAERDARVASIYARLPRLKELDEKRQSLIFERGMALFSGTDALSIEKKLSSLDDERLGLLSSIGESPSAFEPEFSCPLCRDTGFVGEGVKELCSCIKQRVVAENFKSANLPEGDCFESFREDIYPSEKQKKQARKLRELCQSYADSFPAQGAKGIVIYGKSGLGKTFLLRCLARRVLERGYSVVDITGYGLLRELMLCIQNRESAPDYSEADLLIIDDLGTEPSYGQIASQTLFSIINERQNLEKPTLIATNLSPEQLLNQYGERLYSRLVSPRLNSSYTLEGEDLRLQPLANAK